MSESRSPFEEQALLAGLVTAEQLDECRLLRDTMRGTGVEMEIAELLAQKNIIRREQIQQVNAATEATRQTPIEGYQFLMLIGEGASGAVYKSLQLKRKRLVAIKIYRPVPAPESEILERFKRDTHTVARIDHPNIVRGLDAGFRSGRCYYVTEYLERETLRDRIARQGRIPWTEAISIALQAGAALEHFSYHGQVHGNLNSSNVLILKDGTVKIADLGVGRFAVVNEILGPPKGTPPYRAPEQEGDGPVDIRADFYALGVLLYQMLSGSSPNASAPVPWEKVNAPGGVVKLGWRLTQPDRDRRHPSPDDLLRDLVSLDEGRSLRSVSAGLEAGPSPHDPFDELFPPTEPQGPPPPAPPPAIAAPAAAAPLAPALPPLHLRPALRTSIRRRKRRSLPSMAGMALVLLSAAASVGVSYTRWADPPPLAPPPPPPPPSTAGDGNTEVEKARAAIRSEVLALASRRRYSAASDALDRHAADRDTPEWLRWIAEERAALRRALEADAQSCRAASAAAEIKGDYAAASRAIQELQTFGIPELASEAAERIRAIDAARVAAARRPIRPAIETPSEDGKVFAFFEQALALAARREYDKIEFAAPKIANPRSAELLRHALAAFRWGSDVWTEIHRHLASRRGPVEFLTRDGTYVAGSVEDLDREQVRVGGRTVALADISTASAAALYRTARGAAVSSEALVHFLLFERDPAAAEELLKRHPVELHPLVEGVYRLALAERDAHALLVEVDLAPAEERPTKLGWILERFPGTPSAEAARRLLAALAPEVVVYAGDLAPAAFQGALRPADEEGAAGGRAATVPEDASEAAGVEQGHATFRVRVHPGIPYRAWVRVRRGVRAGRPEEGLLYLQVSGAVDPEGKEAWDPGSKSRILLRGTLDSPWKWASRDLADSTSVEPVIRFRVGGEVTVRLGASGSGSGFDQVVLSPRRFLDGPPAEAILPKPR
jgi:serine/threonine protein kinase